MKTKLLHIICLLVLLVFHSCSHDDFDKEKDKSNLSIDEARAYFENNATDLRYNELVYSYTPTKADDNIVPLWDKAKHGTTPNSEVVMIPILEAGKIKALLTTTMFGRKRGTTDNVKVESHLVIQRYNTSGKMRRFITTVVGISDDAKANPYIFTGDRTKFQGFMLISDETGKCEEVFYYTGGRRFKMQIGNYTAEEKRKNKHLQMSVGFSFMETSVAVKGGGGHLSGEEGDSYCYNCHSLTNFDSWVCAICGAEPQEIGGGEAYFFCKGCGKLVKSCICEHEPTPDPDPENPNEEACPLCDSRYCNGECSDLGSGERGGGDEPEPPQTPANPIDTAGYSKSTIIPCVMYDTQETMNAIEPTISLLANGCNSSKIMGYIKRQNIPIIFESVPGLFNAYETSPGVSKISGQVKYIRITFYEGAEFKLGEILHEFTHGWYKMMYPGVSLNDNMNSDAISTIAECLSLLDYPNLYYHFVEHDKMRQCIPPFWDNPCPETFEILRQFIIGRSKTYESYILDETTFYKQIDDFKNLLVKPDEQNQACLNYDMARKSCT